MEAGWLKGAGDWLWGKLEDSAGSHALITFNVNDRKRVFSQFSGRLNKFITLIEILIFGSETQKQLPSSFKVQKCPNLGKKPAYRILAHLQPFSSSRKTFSSEGVSFNFVLSWQSNEKVTQLWNYCFRT